MILYLIIFYILVVLGIIGECIIYTGKSPIIVKGRGGVPQYEIRRNDVKVGIIIFTVMYVLIALLIIKGI